MVGPPLTRDGPATARFRFFFGFDSTTTKAPGAKSESESTTMGAGIEADSPTFDDIGKMAENKGHNERFAYAETFSGVGGGIWA